MNVLTPPKPPSGKATATADGPLIGRALVSKLSLAQKASNEKDSQDAASDLLSALTDLRLVVSRRGLLRGDTSRAEAYLTKLSEVGSNGGGSGGVGQNDGGGGKRRKKGGSGGGAPSNKASNFVDGSPSHVGKGILDDEVLLLIGLGRILGAGKSAAAVNTLTDGVVQEAAEVLLAICRHVTTYSSSGSPCINAECELLLVACPQLLSGLGNIASHLLERDSMEALASCHRAASSIIILLGTRLSRSTATMEKISSTATEAIFNFGGDATTSAKHSIQAAATLLAATPLAGNADGTSPGILWTDAIMKATKSLTLVLSIFFPMHKSASKARQFVDSNDRAWVDLVDKSMASQEDRTNEFLRRIEGYSSILKSLLDLEGCDGCLSEDSVSCASIPIGCLLDLVELMLAFPSAAEARYLSTKSKLRDISIENGVLSPSSAMAVANGVKCDGLDLFDRIVSSASSSGIVHGGRIMRLASSSLQSSCSYALKRSIDPVGTPAMRADGKRGRRWLHDSLGLRRMSVRSFGNAMLRTGPSIALSTEGSFFAKSLIFVSGCLLEQTNKHDASPEADWGNLSDKIGLVCECAKVLESALSVAGPYLDVNTRSTIESVAGTCLTTLSGKSISSTAGPALFYALAKCSLMKLASTSICAPWSDGAGSSLIGLLRRTAESLKRDNNSEVAAAAYSAICLCDAITIPRSPPMAVISRSVGIEDGYAYMAQEGKPFQSAFTASDILGGIEAAKKEVQAATAIPTNESADQEKPKSSEKRKSKPTDDAPKIAIDVRDSKKQKKGEARPKEAEAEGTAKANSNNNHGEVSVGETIDEEDLRKDKFADSVKENGPESMEVENTDSVNDDKEEAETFEAKEQKPSAFKRESEPKPSSTKAEANSFAKMGGDDSDSDSLGEMPGIVMVGPDDDDM